MPPSSNVHSPTVLQSSSKLEHDMRQPSRRQAMESAGAPMLPLGGTAAASLLAAFGGAYPAVAGSAGFVSAKFSSTPAPTPGRRPRRWRQPRSARSLTASFSDGSSRLQAGLPAVLHHRRHGAERQGRQDPLPAATTTSTTSRSSTTSVPARSASSSPIRPDGTSLLTARRTPSVTGVKGNAVFAVVQFEYTTRDQDGEPACTACCRRRSPC